MSGKYLSWVLRHGLLELGLVPNESGYVTVDSVINLPESKKRRLTYDEINEIVKLDSKQRYKMEKVGDTWYIRANQGHSHEVVVDHDPSKLYTEITDPDTIPVCVHGTYKKFAELIMSDGLKRMSRSMIHFAPGLPGDKEVISGMRGSCDCYVFVDVKKAMADGMKFWKSDNNVILTDGFDGIIPPKYLHIN